MLAIYLQQQWGLSAEKTGVYFLPFGIAWVFGTALTGLGCGIFSPSLNAAALLAVDPAYAGLGSGVLNTARQVGMATGVALLGSLIGMHDTMLGLRVSVVLVAICFFAIIGLSVAYVPRKETARTGRSPSRTQGDSRVRHP